MNSKQKQRLEQALDDCIEECIVLRELQESHDLLQFPKNKHKQYAIRQLVDEIIAENKGAEQC